MFLSTRVYSQFASQVQPCSPSLDKIVGKNKPQEPSLGSFHKLAQIFRLD